MTECEHEFHNLYPMACPGCAPEKHAEMLAQAPEGMTAAATPEDATERPTAAQGPLEGIYGDTY